MAMARPASVTVSMAAEISGMPSSTDLVRRVRVSAWAGSISEAPGTSNTSSKVRASRMVWLLGIGHGSVLERRACSSGSLIPQERLGPPPFAVILPGFLRLLAERGLEPKPGGDVLTGLTGPLPVPGLSPRSFDMEKKFRLLMG